MGLTPIFPFRDLSSIINDNLRAADNIVVQNDNLDNEDESSSDYYTSSSDDTEESEYESYTLSHMLFTPSLEDLRKILYVALNPYFEEFEIEVISCPCLTKAPYNLAAAGLSGNTGILELGTFENLYPRPWTNKVYNIYAILSRCNDDVFVIGSGFTTQPSMPYNGHLTMNAVVSVNPTHVINNSCITYKDVSTNQRKLEIINEHNQIKCCLFGQFFFSGGKRGPVIKIRAKGRRSRSSIIALIQAAMTNCSYYHPLIGLGIVLVLNGGRTEQRFLPNNFVRFVYNEILDYYCQLSPYMLNCRNLVALGTVVSEELIAFVNNDKVFLIDNVSMFNGFSNKKSLGNFFNDLTPEETEYIVYINIAQERIYFK